MESMGYTIWAVAGKILPWHRNINPNKEDKKMLKADMFRQKVEFYEKDDNFKVRNSFQVDPKVRAKILFYFLILMNREQNWNHLT